MTDTILCTVDGAVATITLNRPDKLNAATPEMAKAIVAAVTACNDSDTIRCVIVTGAGPKAFCAGSDIAELDRYATRSEEHTSELQSLMRISYAVFCLKKKKTPKNKPQKNISHTKPKIPTTQQT